MFRLAFLLVALALLFNPAVAAAADKPAGGLEIYLVDTEGGAATLMITPARESVLIDCGNPGARDAERIHAAARDAGIDAIDHLIITHWHTDHYGGVARLSELMPIRHFYDHGIPDSLQEDPVNFPLLIQAYKTATKGKSTHLRPGDAVPLRQAASSPALRLQCLCGERQAVPDRPGAPENPAARKNDPQPDDPTDNARSLGFLLTFGNFRFLDLGDLTWNIEYKLVHPTNKIGLVDVYQSTHHGLEISNNPAVINSVRPIVAVFNNGPRKGGHPSVVGTLRRSGDIQAIYQVHRNVLAADQENTEAANIANVEEKCQGEYLHLAVAPYARSYTVSVGKNGKPRRFETRAAK
jgi:beta-lactamase superfamily II metal-dependent hydrolase